LIHSAAGGVGLAAIKIAKVLGAEVFATASLPKQDIVRYWGADHVYDSRSLEFECQIIKQTSGEGVDVVLNSLSGAYQSASLRLLRAFGRFIEIGKRDIYEHRALNQYDLRRNIGFHVIDMSKLSYGSPDIYLGLFKDVKRALQRKEYVPLPLRTYRAAHIGQALRTMATGRHLGKIIIGMQDTAVVPRSQPRTWTNDYKKKTVVITGGISGVGFEVAKYLTMAGVGEIILASRLESGSSKGSEAVSTLLRYGMSRVSFVQCDVTNRADVDSLIAVATKQTEATLSIIHAAGIYDDKPVSNLDWESFRSVCAPKVFGAMNLHMATLGLNLEAFCLVSSVSSMLGNAGQCSYAVANAFLDGLAHFRKSQHLIGTSINFGPFSDIGFLADKPTVRNIVNRTGISFVPKTFGIKAMENSLAMGLTQIGVFDIDWQQWLSQMRFKEMPDKLKAIVASSTISDENSLRVKIDILKDLNRASPVDRPKVIESYLCRHLAAILSIEPNAIDTGTDLSSQGLDSLSTVELALSIECDMKLNLTPEEFSDARTVQTIAKLLHRKYETRKEIG
jgi:NADPH:quinone reductase-like Zn-dependent oxidoreductase/acyl carrier protein